MLRDQMGRPVFGLMWGAVVALASGACSMLFATSGEQCATDGDCEARGFGAMRCSAENVCVMSSDVIAEPDAAPDAAADSSADPFACANLPLPSPDPSRQVDVAIRYADFSAGTPPKNTLVRLCSAPDGLCNNPRATVVGDDPGADAAAGGWVLVPDDGKVTAKVEYGFEGFFEVKAEQYPPTFRYTSPPLRASVEFEQLLLRPGEIHFLANTAMGKSDGYNDVDYGLVFLFARDCNQEPLAGVSFSTPTKGPEEMTRFYVLNSNPSLDDTVTDALGRGGYINVPPGIHTFEAWFGTGTDKKWLGSSHVLVRAGAATTVSILPSQAK